MEDFNFITKDQVTLVENQLQVKMPVLYINYINQYGYGELKKSDFMYFDESFQKERISSIGAFLNFDSESYNSILKDNLLSPEFFPKNLIAFAEVGNGDLICFDYTSNKSNLNPPIVYWDHGADVGKDVSFVANNFEEFIGMLRESDVLPQG